jgi:iron complex transport system permease protein
MPSHKPKRWLSFIGIGLVVFFFLSVFIGRYPKPFWMPPTLLTEDDLAWQLLFNLRLPRLLTALLLGATLSACGTVLQMIFRNPLVEPGFLGVSQGAAFGAAASILWLGRSPLVIEIVATIFGLGGLFLSYYLANRFRFGGWVLRLVLAGIAVSALFSAGVGILKFIADPLTQLPDITFWLLGGLYSVTWSDFLYLLPVVVFGLVVAYLMRWRLNLLALDDETAFSFGILPSRERVFLLVAVVSATAAITSVSGVVGWVGLIVPHISRRIFGASGQFSLPGAMLVGGIFTMLCDDVARTLMAGEIPLGIVTSLIGAVLFLYLMIRLGSREDYGKG